MGKALKQTDRPRHFIREWRDFRGFNQEQFAERVGVDRSYISKIETGKKRYDQPFLEAAAEALNVTPADLIMRDPSDPQGLWSIYEQLAPKQREVLVEHALVIKKTGTGA